MKLLVVWTLDSPTSVLSCKEKVRSRQRPGRRGVSSNEGSLGAKVTTVVVKLDSGDCPFSFYALLRINKKIRSLTFTGSREHEDQVTDLDQGSGVKLMFPQVL